VLKHQRLHIGVCGIGSIGFRHARLLSDRPDVDLYVCDPVSKHVDAALALRSVRDTTDSFEAMLELPLDGIILATPDTVHVEQGVAACRKGIPVLLEKPVAENMTQGCKLLEAVRDTGTAVLIGYVLRYAECMNLTKRFLAEGRIGTPVSFQILLGSYETLLLAKNRFSPTDRNKLFGDYSHEWDYLQWFLGPVRRVVAVSHQFGQLQLIQNPNVMDGLLELEGGITGTVHLDYIQLPGRRRFSLIGDGGTLDVDVDKSQVTLSQRGEDFIRNHQQLEHRDAMMQKQHDHFLAIIREGISPRVSLDDGLRALCVADALIRSTQSGLWESVEGTEFSPDRKAGNT
jgi:predicted dehydrogenase